MKRVILSAIMLLGITTIVSAQSTNNKKASKTVAVHKASKNKKATTPVKEKSTVRLNNRKIYHWTNGQRSTPTGQDATSSNGSAYSAIKKDTAKVIKKKDE